MPFGAQVAEHGRGSPGEERCTDLRRRKRVLHEERLDGAQRFLLAHLDENFPVLTGFWQPFYPGRELALPRDIQAALDETRVKNEYERNRVFPSLYDIRPMTRGIYGLNWSGQDHASFSADQVHASGVSHGKHFGAAVRGSEAENIYLSDIARVLYVTLLYGRRLYWRFGFSGLVEGAIELTGARGRPVRMILSARQFQDGSPRAIDAAYRWPIEADTHQFGDDDWLRAHFYRSMREIYSALRTWRRHSSTSPSTSTASAETWPACQHRTNLTTFACWLP